MLTQIYIKTLNCWYRSDIASSTNRKCSLNLKFRHPERKFDEVCFLKFSPCFSVKFVHFGEHFFLKTPMPYVYVCLLLDLLISFHFNRKFTRKLHCLHQLIRTPFFPHLTLFRLLSRLLSVNLVHDLMWRLFQRQLVYQIYLGMLT